MPRRPLGPTGHDAGLFSLGGQGVIEQAGSEATAIAVVRRSVVADSRRAADGRHRHESACSRGTLTMEEALHYVWTHPVSKAIVGCDHPGHVDANAAAARCFTPFLPSQMRMLESRTASIARQALFFRNWNDASTAV